MTILQANAINPAALIVPGLYIQIVPPQNVVLNGVPTNKTGAVGTATWGPKNSPQIVSDQRSCAAVFGPIQARKYDLNTVVNAGLSQGANNYLAVRVTDGTDVAATSAIQGTGGNATGKWTGTFGNQIQFQIVTGSAVGTFAALISLPGIPTERFDNITGTGNAFWLNLASAINNGQSGTRAPSNIITFTAGALTAAPTLATYSFTGGTDGVGTITTAVLVGTDGLVRSGMYSLRGQGCSIGVLADADDSTQWTYQLAYGLSDGVYMIGTTPLGDTVANAITTKATAGIDSYAFKLMFGDWIYTLDQVNQIFRYVAPSGFMAGLLANLSPNQSSLNKQMNSIIGTQRSATGQPYSNAELQALAASGIDVIGNPSAGGQSYFSPLIGHNSSSNANIHGDNYTRMTNFIAATLNAGMGQFIGQPNTDTLRLRVKATLDTFFLNLVTQGLLSNVNGAPPFVNQCDSGNNPQSLVSIGYLNAYSKVIFQSIAEEFILSLEGGQTVQIARAVAQPALQS